MYLKFFKRFFDLVFSIVLGLIMSPFILIISFIILCLYGWPIFYIHSRIGFSGKLINIFKFRTMYVDAEVKLEKHLRDNPKDRKIWSEKHKLTNDPRITKFGLFLRKYSLDELPQILNVLKGEMSLIGPRPIVDSEIKKYGDSFNFYKKVKPGITGLWQVSGRNDIDYSKRVALDEFYVSNVSFLLDLMILLKTLPAIISKKGAY